MVTFAMSSQKISRHTHHSGAPRNTPRKARGTPTSQTVPVSSRQANRVSPPARKMPTTRAMLSARRVSCSAWRMSSILARASVSADTWYRDRNSGWTAMVMSPVSRPVKGSRRAKR